MFDGREDQEVSEKLFSLVSKKMQEFRIQLLNSKPPRNISSLVRAITPTKGVHTKYTKFEAPPDEGIELFDCEGDELDLSELYVFVEEDMEIIVEERGSERKYGRRGNRFGPR